MFAIELAKLPPPRPAVAAIRQKTQNGVLGPLHGVREPERRDQQQGRAGHRPVAAAELRDRERVRQPEQRADQVGQRHQQEELLRRVVEAGRDQERRADAPDQPDREAEVLGEDRPDQVAPGDRPCRSRSQNSGSSGRQSSIQRPVRREGVGVRSRRPGAATSGFEVRVMRAAPVRSVAPIVGAPGFVPFRVTVSSRSLCPHGLTDARRPQSDRNRHELARRRQRSGPHPSPSIELFVDPFGDVAFPVDHRRPSLADRVRYHGGARSAGCSPAGRSSRRPREGEAASPW